MAIIRLTSFVCWVGKGNGVNNEEIFIDYCKRMAILCTSWARSLLVLDQSNFRGFKIRKWLALNTGKRDWNREVVVGMRLVTANLLICQINQLSLKKSWHENQISMMNGRNSLRSRYPPVILHQIYESCLCVFKVFINLTPSNGDNFTPYAQEWQPWLIMEKSYCLRN